MKKSVLRIFFILTCLSLLTPLWVFRDLLFPFVTSKAFYFRIAIELALPFYAYLLISRPDLRPKWKSNPLNVLVVLFLLFNLISGLLGVNVLRSLWGNFERMGGVYYLAHLSLLYFYSLMIAQMNDKDAKDIKSYAWAVAFGILTSLVFGLFGLASFGQAFGLAVGLSLYLSIASFAEGGCLKRLLVPFLIMALAVTLNGVLAKINSSFGWGLPILSPDPSLPVRVSSTLGNPIYLGSFLVVPLFLSLYFALQEQEKFQKWAYYVMAVLFFIGIWLSGTRGALVGLVVGSFLSALAYVFLAKSRRVKIFGFLAVTVFVIVAGLMFSFSSHLPVGSVARRLFTLKDTNTEARLIQWKTAIKGYKDHVLFGVGPENYYVISNKYYNPEIFKYDASWFDKPHNYLLEILVTGGIFSFLAYLATLLFMALALYRGYKSDILSLPEFCVLLAGLTVYQIQNLTVFDTVPASLTFYVFLAFAAYVWTVTRAGSGNAKSASKKIISKNQEVLATSTGAVCLLVIVYTIYASNIVPIKISKAVNYGYAYSSVDVGKAAGYFDTAVSLPFNFDPVQTGSKYADFATTFASDPKGQTPDAVNKILDKAISAANYTVSEVSNDPTAWQQLANLYLTKSISNRIPLDSKAFEAAQQAINLAPIRPEPEQVMARLQLSQNNFSEAEKIMSSVVSNIPWDYEAKLQLALIYYYDNQVGKALAIGQDALDTGYKPPQIEIFNWMGPAYEKLGNFGAAAKIYELAREINPSNLQNLQQLAQVYAKLGRKAEAITVAQELIQLDPSNAQKYQSFIDSLK